MPRIQKTISIVLFLLMFVLTSVVASSNAYAQSVDVQNFLNQYQQDLITGDLANPLGLGVDAVQISSDPSAPGPNETVTVEATSLKHDLRRTNITWYLNDQPVLQGLGRTKMTFVSGAIGQPSIIRFVAQTEGGTTFSETFVISPVHLDIAWEADTFTPPFYQGKALHSASTFITLHAIPTFVDREGNLIDPDDLFFKWKIGSSINQDLSGFGRQSVKVPNEQFIQSLKVELEVTTKDETLEVKKKLIIPVEPPELYFYEVHPLLGVLYNSVVGDSFDLTNEEITILAEPYFFPGTDRSDFAYERIWRMDKTPIQAGEAITLRPVGTAEGVSTIDLTMRHSTNILQAAQNQFSVRFSNTEQDASSEAF